MHALVLTLQVIAGVGVLVCQIVAAIFIGRRLAAGMGSGDNSEASR